MRAALLKGQSQYGVLRAFVDEVGAGLIARGWDVSVLDLERCSSPTEIADALAASGTLDLVFSVNSFGEFRDSEGRTITDLTGAPHVLQYVDYPLHTLERFASLSPSAAVLLVDRSHIRTVEALFGKDRYCSLVFAPHGGMGTPVVMPPTAAEWAAERPVSVLFAGSNYVPDASLMDGMPEFVKSLFEAAVERALAVEWISPLDALDAVLAANGLDPNDPSRSDAELRDLRNVRLLASFVQEAVRRERRQRFLVAIKRADLPLTVVGHGWDGRASGLIDNRGPLEIDDCLKLMRQSRFAINLSGNFGQGSHERPLSAMIAGCAVGSDHTSFYEEAFKKDREIALFRWSSLDADLARLAALTRDTKAMFEMARAGHAVAAASHRWDHRVDGIIAAGKAVAQKLNLPSRLAG